MQKSNNIYENVKVLKNLVGSFSSYYLKKGSVLKIYVRGLDFGLLTTNIDAPLLPQAFRWPRRSNLEKEDCSFLKLYLTPQDVLPSIPSCEELKLWKLKWKQMVYNLYNFALGIDNNPIGSLWFNDPDSFLLKFRSLINLSPSFDIYLQKVQGSLKQMVLCRDKVLDFSNLFSFLDKQNFSEIHVYTEGYNFSKIFPLLTHAKVKKIFLFNPLGSYKLVENLLQSKKVHLFSLILEDSRYFKRSNVDFSSSIYLKNLNSDSTNFNFFKGSYEILQRRYKFVLF